MNTDTTTARPTSQTIVRESHAVRVRTNLRAGIVIMDTTAGVAPRPGYTMEIGGLSAGW